MASRARFLEAVRSFVGAPYVPNGRTPDGVDCAGIAIGALALCGHPIDERITYGALPTPEEAERWVSRFAHPKPLERAEPGDLVVTVLRGSFGHLVVDSGDGNVIRVDPKRGVREVPLSRAYRPRSRWHIRGVV